MLTDRHTQTRITFSTAGAGFDGAQESALDLLGELALRYAGEVGAGARSYAELAGRSSVTFSDVVRWVTPRAPGGVTMYQPALACRTCACKYPVHQLCRSLKFVCLKTLHAGTADLQYLPDAALAWHRSW